MPVRILSIDCETELTRPGVKLPRLVCVSASIDGVNAELLHHTHAVPFLLEAFKAAARGEVRIIGHNLAAFDLPVFAAHEPRLLPYIFDALDADGVQDTMLNEQLIDLARGELRGKYEENEDGESVFLSTGYSLDAISQRRLSLALDKGEDGWRLRYGELRDTPLEAWPERARAYAEDDARVTWQVYKQQWYEARDLYPDLLKPAPGEARAAFALGLMAAWGLCTSRERIDRLEALTAEKLERARADMEAAGLIRLGGTKKAPKWVRNTQPIKDRVVAALGEDAPRTAPSKKFPEGQIQASAWILKMAKDPALSSCVDYARAQKTLTTYVPLLRRGEDTPIQCGFNSILDTGRVSTFDPNLQNIPRLPGPRECVTPRPGTVFCSVDYDGAEMRAWAAICLRVLGFSTLAEMFQANADADPHTGLAADILGITEDEALRLKKAKDPQVKDARQRAKSANFGLMGGMGGAKFAALERKKFYESDGKEGVDMTEEEGEELRALWKRRRPEAARYFDWVTAQLREGSDGDSRGTFRCLASGRYVGGRRFTQGANLGFQAFIAWGAKAALYEVTKACYVDRSSPLYGARVVNFAHDEIITELPIERAHEAAHEQARIQRDVMQALMPEIPVTASPALMTYWAKDAEPVYVDGVLIPWVGKDPLAADVARDVQHKPSGQHEPEAYTGAERACHLCGGIEPPPASAKWWHVPAWDSWAHPACMERFADQQHGKRVTA